MKIINIGVLAHVDAGKTTLTEQFLFESGVINEVGSVDKGSTATDSLEIERKRGITIKAAAVSFMVGDVKVNLIDTPGHADFISEVEHSLSVLDGAILVISAVEGVQAQTRILMEALKQQQIPTLMFMNKLDRMGADYKRVSSMIRQFLDERVCEMNTVLNIGSSYVNVIDREDHSSWLEVLALNSEDLFGAYVAEEKCSEPNAKKGAYPTNKNSTSLPSLCWCSGKGRWHQIATYIPSNVLSFSKRRK